MGSHLVPIAREDLGLNWVKFKRLASCTGHSPERPPTFHFPHPQPCPTQPPTSEPLPPTYYQAMNKENVVRALKVMKKETPEFRRQVWYQQVLNQLEGLATFSKDTLIYDCPGVSNTLIKEVEAKIEHFKRKASTVFEGGEVSTSSKRAKTLLKCQNCSQEFKNQHKLKEHVQESSRNPQFGTCQTLIEGESSEGASSIPSVQEQHNASDDRQIVPCILCNLKFSSFNAVDEHIKKDHEKNKAKGKTTKKIVPQPRSGGFAILKALKEENGDLKKEELKDAAQKYCDRSLKETGQQAAWKDMARLLKNGLVKKYGKGLQESYSITEKGKILIREVDSEKSSEHIGLKSELMSIGPVTEIMLNPIIEMFRSQDNLRHLLSDQSSMESRINILRVVKIYQNRILPRHICKQIVEHFS